jgi:hypothetical protein
MILKRIYTPEEQREIEKERAFKAMALNGFGFVKPDDPKLKSTSYEKPTLRIKRLGLGLGCSSSSKRRKTIVLKGGSISPQLRQWQIENARKALELNC